MSNSNSLAHILSLPNELQTHIFTFCEVQSVIQLAATCKTLNQLAFQDEIWFPLLHKELIDSKFIFTKSFKDQS